MDSRVIALLVIFVAAVSFAGCTTPSAGPAGTPAIPASLVLTTTPITASSVPVPVNPAAMTITASPLKYSPVMSSTPGIGLEPVVTGFDAGNATFTWKTTYGWFLSWNAPDFRVNELGGSATNHGEKVYWSFIDRPASTEIPVTITVTATDLASGRILGSSTVTLGWEDNFSVVVRDGE
jgi:hypothetical protein